MSILIKNGKLITVDNIRKADLLIEQGRISQVADNIDSSSSVKETIDASGCYVMPGGIDPHTHMQLPFMGTVAADDFFTGTRAALAGGTTMLIDFVIPNPQQRMMDALKQWKDWAQKACMDYSFHMAVTWWDDKMANEMAEVVKSGINSFKHFMAYKGAIMVDDEIMVSSFQTARELGAICTIHAENGELVFRKQQELLQAGITGPEGHPLSRPPEVEGEAANRAIVIANELGVPVYIVHTSCKQALDAISRGRRSGKTVIGEALIGHLLVNEAVYYDKDWTRAAAHVMSPPFRPPEHQEALWDALNNGDIQVIGTDHCVFKHKQKAAGKGDFTKIPNGTNGLQDRMHLLWHYGVNMGRITMNDFVALTSTNAAKIFNIYPRKGSLNVGADADLVVWDPEAKRTISAKEHLQNVDFNVFEGRTVKGINRVTISKGKVVFDNGQAKVEEGAGEFVARSAFAPYFDALRQYVAISPPTAVKR